MKLALFLAFILVASSIPINSVHAVFIITIKSDGSIVPSTVPIHRNGSHYIFTSNIQGYILVERDNIVIEGEGYILKVSSGCPVPDRNGMFLSGRRNVTIKNIQIEMAWYGILAENCSNITISGVAVTGSLHGLILSGSSSNKVVESILASNYHDGIQIYDSTNNTIKRNTIKNNAEEGITLELSSYNNVTENVIERNLDGIVLIESPYNRIIGNNITVNTDTGMWLYCSSENLVHHNNFIGNPVQIYTFESCNVWDDGFEGNYWSNYAGLDSDGDGIGDSPYVIGDSDQDRYPLMNLCVIPEFPHTLFFMLSMIAILLGMVIYKKKTKLVPTDKKHILLENAEKAIGTL